MICASCGHENPAGGKFCLECGAPLARVCPSCGAAVGASRFCGECGTPLPAAAGMPTAPPPPQTERRVCSVLFADLVGFTPLSEARDPEEVRELLSRYFDTARTVITRYGGVVEKFIGDAVMAVWGTPVAAEGDAERAVRAGLDLVSAVATLGTEVGADGLALRAGVVTGEVAAALGAVGEGMVAGDAVNTAARVQSAATPGTVWVDSATQRLAAAGVGFQHAGAHALKGKAEPVALWQATRVLSSVGGAQRVDGLEAPMIGRDAEYRTLRELFHASAERRTPRLVTIIGAAGSGKSRLGWEFEKYVDGLAEVVAWHRGRCLSYGEGVAYWALAEAVRQRFGIAAEDPVDEADAKFHAGLEQWLGAPEERSFVGVRLGRLLGLTHPDDRGVALGRDDLFVGWRLLLERMADVEPVLVLVEDAQHADDALLDFVEHVVDWARQSPIYLVLLGRSELIERRPDLAGGRNRSSLTLDPLDERSMRALVDGLVRDMPDTAVSAIVGQAQGNPLFAVETIRSLIDQDVIVPVDGEYRLVGDRFEDMGGVLSVPDSLHALLAARLDALDPSLRSLVADAAVLGTSFPAEALVAVSGRPAADVMTGLAELVRREVLDVSTDPLSPERGSYVFGQNMLRQVAYDTLARRDRRARHLAVAEHLQRSFTGEGDEVMDVVAQHYLDALAALSDPSSDDELRAKALSALIRAAERAERSGAPLRAARSFDRAGELAMSTDRRAAAGLWQRAGEMHSLSLRFGEAFESLERARAVYEAEGDERAAARVLAGIGQRLLMTGRSSDARAAVDEALAVLRANPDHDTVVALNTAARCAVFGGSADARQLADESIGLAQALDVPTALLAEVFDTQGLADLFHQRVAQSRSALRYAAELAEQAGATVTRSRVLNNLATLQLGVDAGAALRTGLVASELARTAGSLITLETSHVTLGMARMLTGDWDAAVAELAALQEDLGAKAEDVHALRAVLLALRGDPDAARDLALLPGLRASEDIQDVAVVGYVDATLAAAAGRPREALDHLGSMFETEGSIALISEYVFLSWPLAVRCAFEIGDLAGARRLVTRLDAQPIGHLPVLLRGERRHAEARLAVAEGAADADATLADGVAAVRETGSPYHLAHALLDQVAQLVRDGQDATAQLAEARAIGEALRATDALRRVSELAGSVPVVG